MTHKAKRLEIKKKASKPILDSITEVMNSHGQEMSRQILAIIKKAKSEGQVAQEDIVMVQCRAFKRHSIMEEADIESGDEMSFHTITDEATFLSIHG